MTDLKGCTLTEHKLFPYMCTQLVACLQNTNYFHVHTTACMLAETFLFYLLAIKSKYQNILQVAPLQIIFSHPNTLFTLHQLKTGEPPTLQWQLVSLSHRITTLCSYFFPNGGASRNIMNSSVHCLFSQLICQILVKCEQPTTYLHKRMETGQYFLLAMPASFAETNLPELFLLPQQARKH